MLVGLTGLIGSGKTTVALLFTKLGIKIIDTDRISHQLTMLGGSALLPILQTFGTKLVETKTGLNRKLMQELVFNDEASRLKLEQILHPLIYQEVLNEIKRISSQEYALIIVPLLFKNPEYLALIQRSLYIDSDYNLLKSRVLERSGLNEEIFDKIVSTQVNRALQLKLADDVIVNNGNLMELKMAVSCLHLKYLNLITLASE